MKARAVVAAQVLVALGVHAHAAPAHPRLFRIPWSGVRTRPPAPPAAASSRLAAPGSQPVAATPVPAAHRKPFLGRPHAALPNPR